MIPASFPLPACLTAGSLARLARAYPAQVAGALLALPQGAAARAWDWAPSREVERLMREAPVGPDRRTNGGR